jgi:hypothetical protein
LLAWYPVKHQVLIHHDQELTRKLTKTTSSASAFSLCICYRFSEHLSTVGKYQFLHPGSTESAAHRSTAFPDANGDWPIVDTLQCGADTLPSLHRRMRSCALRN